MYNIRLLRYAPRTFRNLRVLVILGRASPKQITTNHEVANDSESTDNFSSLESLTIDYNLL